MMPDNVRALRGNPGKRTPPARPKAVAAIPNPPTSLSREARAEWRRITPEMHRMGILALIDRAVLTLYCKAWARWVELDRTLDEEGTVLTEKLYDKEGLEIGERKVKHPAWQQWKEAATIVANLAKECGTSPNARLRMLLPKNHEPDTRGLD